MITVIKHGKHKFMKCITCGCEFTYEKEDITSTQSGVSEIKCPDCGKKILVSYWRD
jgi:DNA-directed RNA polymerase subunit RPC12/RpoP